MAPPEEDKLPAADKEQLRRRWRRQLRAMFPLACEHLERPPRAAAAASSARAARQNCTAPGRLGDASVRQAGGVAARLAPQASRPTLVTPAMANFDQIKRPAVC